MLLISITACSLILSVHTQNFPIPNPFFPDQSFFGDGRSFLPFPVFDINSHQRWVQQNIDFIRNSVYNDRKDTSVEVERSKEVASTTTYEIEKPKQANGPITAVGNEQTLRKDNKGQVTEAIKGQNEQIGKGLMKQVDKDNAIRVQNAHNARRQVVDQQTNAGQISQYGLQPTSSGSYPQLAQVQYPQSNLGFQPSTGQFSQSGYPQQGFGPSLISSSGYQQTVGGQYPQLNQGQFSQSGLGVPVEGAIQFPGATSAQIPKAFDPLPLSVSEPTNTLSPAKSPNRVAHTKVLYSVTKFGLNLMRDIDQAGNVVVSPYSIACALALLQQGAAGSTQEQISSALQMTPSDAASAFQQLTEDFKQRNSRNILKTASNVFVGESFTLNPKFKKIAQESFGSDLTPARFSRPETAARQINRWVASHTDNKIENLVTPESLDAITQMVLVNAVYFKGIWEVPFRVETTKPREFHLSSGAVKTVPFMSSRRHLKTGIDATTSARITILPFEGYQYSLMLILPSNLLGVSGTLEQMTDAMLVSYHGFTAQETALYVPKFTIKADTNLIPVLRKMGITNIFGPNADLNGLGSYRAFSPQVSSAVHSAVLSIDEQGGSAAAATAFAAVALSNDQPSMIFKADRPFIAVLWDEKSSLPLFMARIEDPTQM